MARTKLTDLYKSLNDKPLHEQMSPETLMVKLGGDAKTELKVSNQMDDQGNIDLSNITLEFKDKKYEGLEFEYEDEVEDHGSVKVLLFTAEAEDGTIFDSSLNRNDPFNLNICDYGKCTNGPHPSYGYTWLITTTLKDNSNNNLFFLSA